MSESSRRESIIGMLTAALAGSLAAVPSSVLAQPQRDIPRRPLRFSRLIEHRFHNNVRLSVFRSWGVLFEYQNNGIGIKGEQIDVAVDAPPSLDSLALAEKNRSTNGLWPIRLSSNGLILASGTPDGVSGSIAHSWPASASLLNRLPDDLFYPSLGPLKSVQAIAMPNGMVGEFAVEYAASSAAGSDWLHRAERRVITRLGGTQETAIERWLLTDF